MSWSAGTPEPRGRLLDGEQHTRRGSPDLLGTPAGGSPQSGTPLLSLRRPPRPSTPSTTPVSPSNTGTPPHSGTPQPESIPSSRRSSLLPPGTDSRRGSLTKKALTGLVKDARKGIRNVTDTSMKAGQKNLFASNPFAFVKDKTVSVSGHMKDATVGASQWVASHTSKTAKAAMEQAKSGLSVGEKFTLFAVEKITTFSRKGFAHVFMFLVLAGYTALGALLFIALEAPHENEEKAEIEKARAKLIESVWESLVQNKGINFTRWEGIVTGLLKPYDNQIKHSWAEGASPDTDDRIWTFWRTMFFCSTITTTIGYGHIFPRTNAGRALTIVYAIVGIPIFLILMADFGKLFTRLLKSLFVFIKRLYRTATCKRVRKTRAVQSVKEHQSVVVPAPTPPLAVPESTSTDFEKQEEVEQGQLREREPFLSEKQKKEAMKEEQRGGDDNDEEVEVRPCCCSAWSKKLSGWCSSLCCKKVVPEDITPESDEEDIIDDNFNLPVSLALFILLVYIMCGCVIYTMWEPWSYFEAFYFIFVSMTTIGFGDYVPQHPAFMMMTTVYLVFGLALTAMCINIIQEKLTDTFRQASEKLKDSFGHIMAASANQGEEAALQEGKEVEVAEVHGNKKTEPDIVTVTYKKET
ncbi:potassium channel subfamily K member 18-like isoform X2 [Homarus americanus]|uniref:potassium channel subfamily K member 18-like isoform X2 n=1 Tax=Homarus americanus TaxID=6706 RepID=UPI001C4638EC|nr:potassium channel subfamily K member 18-like isoform X2 [Homarus americanus]